MPEKSCLDDSPPDDCRRDPWTVAARGTCSAAFRLKCMSAAPVQQEEYVPRHQRFPWTHWLAGCRTAVQELIIQVALSSLEITRRGTCEERKDSWNVGEKPTHHCQHRSISTLFSANLASDESRRMAMPAASPICGGCELLPQQLHPARGMDFDAAFLRLSFLFAGSFRPLSGMSMYFGFTSSAESSVVYHTPGAAAVTRTRRSC